MIIDNSQISLSAQHARSEREQRHESLQLFRVDDQGQVRDSVEFRSDSERLSLAAGRAMQTTLNNAFPAQAEPGLRPAELSPSAVPSNPPSNAPASALNPPNNAQAVGPTKQDEPQQALDPRTQLIKSILERMLGRSIELGSVEPHPPAKSSEGRGGGGAAAAEQATSAPLQAGMRYQLSETREESELTEFQAQGKVRTRDGREIEFALELSMSRHQVEHRELLIEAGARLKDPLVINFDGRAAELRANRFEFDLDADGQLDSIHQLAEHSGMLALDRNGNGQIDDGRELFGALNGDGFADLAQYDDDGNGFIDEADAVFDRLQVWVKSEQGEDRLFNLAELNIGALYLGSTDTPFDLKGTDFELQGRIRATGVYLSESGQAGTLQQLDLVT